MKVEAGQNNRAGEEKGKRVMSSFVAVLDACVLIPASLRDTLLRAVEKDLYRMQWSNEILEEVRRNLVMQGMTSEEGAQSLVDEMKRYFPDASVDGYTSLTAAMPRIAMSWPLL